MNSNNVSKSCLLLSFVLTLLGCMAKAGEIDRMGALDKLINEPQSQELVAYMSLKTMFPNPQIRALAKAAGNGHISEINKLIAQGVDVNESGERGATALFWALRNVKGFERLLELGANPNIVYGDGSAIMHWVVNHRESDFLVLALKYGGNSNLVAGINKETPLFDTMGPDNKSKIDILLSAGADMNYQRGNGETPVMVAAGFGQFDTVLKLLQRGADYQLRDYYTEGTLMDHISFSRRTIDPNSSGAQWMEKVIVWLESRGASIPEWEDPAK